MRFLALLSFLFVFAPLFLSSSARALDSDPCQFTGGAIYPLSSVRSCLTSLPYDPYIAGTTVDTLRKALGIYAFSDLIENPPADSPLKFSAIAISDELTAIENTQYDNDFAFQNALVDLFNRFQDAHTHYFRPYNYALIQFGLPIPMFSYINPETNIQSVFFSPRTNPVVIKQYNTTFGIDVTKYLGAQIQRVDGVDAMQYFEEYANRYGINCKDSQVRFNRLFAQIEADPQMISVGMPTLHAGEWQARSGVQHMFPSSDSTSFEIRLPNGLVEVIQLPWVAAFGANMNSLIWNSLYLNGFKPEELQEAELQAIEQEKLRRLEAEEDLEAEIQIPKPYRPTPAPSFDTRTIFDIKPEDYPNHHHITADRQSTNIGDYTFFFWDTTIQLWGYNATKTLILRIPSFSSPQNLTATAMGLVAGLQQAATQNYNSLILDVTNNGGGMLCLGTLLIDYLFNSTNRPDMDNYPIDFRVTELNNQLADQAASYDSADSPWSPVDYQNYFTHRMPYWDWLSGNLTARSRGSNPNQKNFSQPLRFAACDFLAMHPLKPSPVQFANGKLAIITNGFSGSTAAHFVNHIKQWENAVTVATGGIWTTTVPHAAAAASGFPPSTPTAAAMSYYSFPGGRVLDSPDLENYLIKSHVNITTYSRAEWAAKVHDGTINPRRLPTTGSYRFPIFEMYQQPKPSSPPDFSLPLEFQFNPADMHDPFDYEITANPTLYWKRIAQKLFASKQDE